MDNTWYNVAIICLFLVVGSVLNFLLLLVITFTRSLQTIHNKFVCHVTAISFLGSSALFSISLAELATTTAEPLDYLCQTQQFIGQLCLSISSLLLLLFGFYRLMSTIRPLTILVHARVKTVNLTLIIPWIIAIILTILVNFTGEQSSCASKDWTDSARVNFIAYFVLIGVLPALCHLGFFITILVTNLRKKRKALEMQKYHESNGRRGNDSLEREENGLVLDNPNAHLEKPSTAKRWKAQSNLATPDTDEDAGVSYDDHGVRPAESIPENTEDFDRTSSVTGRSNDEKKSIDDVQFVDTNDIMTLDGSSTRDVDEIKSELSSSDPMGSEKDGDVDFIMPQDGDFFQDMMNVLHKSFRGSKDKKPGSISSKSDTELQPKPELMGIGMDNEIGSDEDKSFDFDPPSADYCNASLFARSAGASQPEYEDSSLPSTPEFSPDTPPLRNLSRSNSSRSSNEESDKYQNSSDNFSHDENHDYADFECDKRSQSHENERKCNDCQKTPETENPITDKWLLDKILSIEKNQLNAEEISNGNAAFSHSETTETSIPPSPPIPNLTSTPRQPSSAPIHPSTPPALPTRPPPPATPPTGRAHPAPPPLSTLASLQRKHTSEGYPTTLLLLFYTGGFLLLQVQYLIVLFHNSVSDKHTLKEPRSSSATEVSYTVHSIFYVISPWITLAICRPVREEAARYFFRILKICG